MGQNCWPGLINPPNGGGSRWMAIPGRCMNAPPLPLLEPQEGSNASGPEEQDLLSFMSHRRTIINVAGLRFHGYSF